MTFLSIIKNRLKFLDLTGLPSSLKQNMTFSWKFMYSKSFKTFLAVSGAIWKNFLTKSQEKPLLESLIE